MLRHIYATHGHFAPMVKNKVLYINGDRIPHKKNDKILYYAIKQ